MGQFRACFGDGAESEFGLPGDAQLPDQEHVHRRTQKVGDDARNGHSAARKAQNDQVWPPFVFDQRLGQQPSGFFAIAKHHLAKGLVHLRCQTGTPL